MQGLPPSPQPGRAGMVEPEYGPNPDLLRQLLVQDSEQRGMPYVPRDDSVMSGDTAGTALPTMDIGALLASSAQARKAGDMESMRGLRQIIEGRSSDDIARGPKGAGQGLTSAEPITQRMSPRQRLLDALGGSLNPHQQQQ